MAEIKLVENYAVVLARNSVRDSLSYHGEECIALAMFHPTIDDATQQRCPVCFDDIYKQPDQLCTYCFAPGTLVRTESGYRPIEQIVVGERVLTEDGTYQRVTETMSRPFHGVAYQWRTSAMAQPVISTGEHPVWAMESDHRHENKQFMSNGQPYCMPSICEIHMRRHQSDLGHQMSWLEAGNLNERSWVATRVPSAEENLEFVDVPREFVGRSRHTRLGPTRFYVTEDFLWMVGLYLAEGSPGTRSINFGLHGNEVEYQQRLMKIFSDYGYHPVVRQQPNSLGVVVTVCSTMLSKWFPAWLGSGCQNKRIPEELMLLPSKKALQVVQGIWDGDGTKTDPEVGQTSPVLALQLAEILQRNGDQPTIRHLVSRALTPKGNVRRLAYVTSWSTEGFDHRHRKGRWHFGDEQLARMVHHCPVHYVGNVYNLEVEGSHTYVVQNTLVHNCYGTTFAGGVKTAARIWSMFTDKTAEETYREHGVWSADAREIQCEAFPILLEHDYIVRVRRWNEDHTPQEIEGYYEVQQVTRDSMRTGNRFGQYSWDIVGQRANVTELQKNSIIARFPVLNMEFPQAIQLGTTVAPPVVQPDTKVVFYPLPNTPAQGGLYNVQGFSYSQETPSSTWTISNPLGRFPAAVTVIVGGEVVQAEVDFPDIHTIVVSFSTPKTGTVEVV